MDKSTFGRKLLAVPALASVVVVLLATAAHATTATEIAEDTATGLRDQFLPAMVVAIPIVLTLVVAKRVYRWVKGQG